MCGILGGINPKRTITLDRVSTALQCLDHRGPDTSNTWISDSKKVFLGHTRLSIIDLVGGQQPLFNTDKSIVAVVNGEFYQYEEIRVELKEKGYQFSTEIDSEIMIALY